MKVNHLVPFLFCYQITNTQGLSTCVFSLLHINETVPKLFLLFVILCTSRNLFLYKWAGDRDPIYSKRFSRLACFTHFLFILIPLQVKKVRVTHSCLSIIYVVHCPKFRLQGFVEQFVMTPRALGYSWYDFVFNCRLY